MSREEVAMTRPLRIKRTGSAFPGEAYSRYRERPATKLIRNFEDWFKATLWMFLGEGNDFGNFEFHTTDRVNIYASWMFTAEGGEQLPCERLYPNSIYANRLRGSHPKSFPADYRGGSNCLLSGEYICIDIEYMFVEAQRHLHKYGFEVNTRYARSTVRNNIGKMFKVGKGWCRGHQSNLWSGILYDGYTLWAQRDKIFELAESIDINLVNTDRRRVV